MRNCVHLFRCRRHYLYKWSNYCRWIQRDVVLRQLPLGLTVRVENPSYLIWINVLGRVDVKRRIGLGPVRNSFLEVVVNEVRQ